MLTDDKDSGDKGDIGCVTSLEKQLSWPFIGDSSSGLIICQLCEKKLEIHLGEQLRILPPLPDLNSLPLAFESLDSFLQFIKFFPAIW